MKRELTPAPPNAIRADRPRGAARLSIVVAVQPSLWCELLCRALSEYDDLMIVACADSEETLGDRVQALAPKAVIVDYEAMGPNTEGLIARLRRAARRTRVLVLARRSGDETVAAVLRAGASGLVSKQAPLDTLATALRSIAGGEVWANRQTTARVIDQLVQPGRVPVDGDPLLTRREWEVIDAVAAGMTNRAAARRLGISEKTVKTHLNNIFAKTRLRGRFALALWAQGHIQPKT